MKKRGRPLGLVANPDAFADAMEGRSQRWLAQESEMSVSHLNEVLAGRKGVQHDQALRLAGLLHRRPGTLFPQLATFRVESKVFTISAHDDMAATA